MKLDQWIQDQKDSGAIPHSARILHVRAGTVVRPGCICALACNESDVKVCHCRCHGDYHIAQLIGDNDYYQIVEIPRSVDLSNVVVSGHVGVSGSLTHAR